MSTGTAELRRRLRATSGRGRRLRGLAELLAPYKLRVAAMLTSLVAATVAALAPAPLANTSGSTPSTIAEVVMRIGRSRMPAAWMTASSFDIPSRCAALATSTFRIPCLLISPISVTSPTSVQMLSVAPPRPRLMNSSAPAIDIGMETRMTSGSRKLSNSAARHRKMMISASAKVAANPLDSVTS